MKSGAIIIAAFTFIITHAVKAQDIDYVSSTLQSGSISSISVVGDYAYCSVGRLLLTLSVSDPSTPTMQNTARGPEAMGSQGGPRQGTGR